MQDLKLVIDYKTCQWGRDEKMREYLRPQTLFGVEKFDSYLAAAQEWDAKGRPSFIEGRCRKKPPLKNALRRPELEEYYIKVLEEIANDHGKHNGQGV